VNDQAGYEDVVRLACLAISLGALLAWETLAPRRPRRALSRRWPNVGLFVVDSVLLRLLGIASLGGAALFADDLGWGLLNQFDAPAPVEFIAAFVLLDLGMYVQHRLFHGPKWLWRLHAVHHADTEFDVTTGLRFHPGEMVVSFALKAAVIVAIGASLWAVIAFEAMLNAASLFTHANVRLSPRADAALRMLVVTPEMHRIHHSTARDEHNRNFGFLFIWWDRWFRSYRAEARLPQRTMPIGLDYNRHAESQTLLALMIQPFTRPNSDS
jgi:sterol desaturase/sphingolipid hydroxylase (fatty acid hydroxylase superfamily)